LKAYQSIEHAVVMAAGRGLRMRPLTDKIPKAMAPLGESTLIAEGISRLKKEISNVHITVGYKGAMLASHVIERDVSSVINTEGKGNAWWLYNSLLSLIDQPLFVLTCDNVIKINFTSFADEYFDLNAPACMIIPANPNKDVEGDFIFKNNLNAVLNFSRHHKSSLISSGIQILNPKKINQITDKSDNFNETWQQLIDLKEIKCSRKVLDSWYSVDDLVQLEAASKKTEREK
jgi:NDP-sugar pyrophosphorylase family protein